jgi:cell wall-associated NlpC family hydrolase
MRSSNPLAPLTAATVLGAALALAASPAAAQVQVIIGGPDPTPAPRPAHAARARAASNAQVSALHERADDRVSSSLGAQVADYAMRFVGTPYVWGGASPAGFDCSGFTQYVLRQFGIGIPRTADDQFAYGRQVDGDPVPGDLVFFQTYDWGASHVGIYLGNGYFVNSIGPNVHVSSFASGYFTSRYLGARRFVRSD